jgi:hypothetical protein
MGERQCRVEAKSFLIFISKVISHASPRIHDQPAHPPNSLLGRSPKPEPGIHPDKRTMRHHNAPRSRLRHLVPHLFSLLGCVNTIHTNHRQVDNRHYSIYRYSKNKSHAYADHRSSLFVFAKPLGKYAYVYQIKTIRVSNLV